MFENASPVNDGEAVFNNGDGINLHPEGQSPNAIPYEELARQQAMAAIASAEITPQPERAAESPLALLALHGVNIAAMRVDAGEFGIPKQHR